MRPASDAGSAGWDGGSSVRVALPSRRPAQPCCGPAASTDVLHTYAPARFAAGEQQQVCVPGRSREATAPPQQTGEAWLRHHSRLVRRGWMELGALAPAGKGVFV